jgi:hypothetical protein
LGESVILVDSPELLGEMVMKVMLDIGRLQRIRDNGLLRMGQAGAAAKIADCLWQK